VRNCALENPSFVTFRRRDGIPVSPLRGAPE
jgi:hypothetical protein